MKASAMRREHFILCWRRNGSRLYSDYGPWLFEITKDHGYNFKATKGSEVKEARGLKSLRLAKAVADNFLLEVLIFE